MRTSGRQPGAPSVGAIREFGEALASGPFRVAIALSALLHVGLLLGLRGSEAEPPRRPPLRVHFVREASAPPASPPAARRPAQSDTVAGGGKSAPRGPDAPAPQPVPPVPAAPAPAAASPPASPSAPIPAAAAPQPEFPAPPEVEVPASQALPRPAVKTEASPEIPREPRVADAAPVQSAPPAAAAFSGEAAAVGAPSTTAPSDATILAGADSPGRDASRGASATATAAGAAGAGNAGGEGIPASSSPQAAAGEPNTAPGPSAQEIAALRERIAAVARKGYPQIAIRNGWEGRVLVEMQLDLEGRLAAVRLIARSDHSILDEAAITAVRLASPFQPIARVVTVPVEYRLTP